MQQIEKYDLFELKLSKNGVNTGESPPAATFRLNNETCTVRGFHENSPDMTIRFMPEKEGIWQYTAEWGGLTSEGSFECVPDTGKNHGPVRAVGCHFQYADGTRYIPMGTTCYAWVHQSSELAAQTLEALNNAPFNKVRMCVFPKAMIYNQNEPLWYPFEKRSDGSWNVSKPEPDFWKNLEDNIVRLGEMGIEADLILFHPYDRWGFSKMSREDNLIYLDYCVRRLSAYRNIWWSLANEYDLVFSKTLEDWDAFGDKVANSDPYKHLISVHNWVRIYPKRPWLTHVSLQKIQKQDISIAFQAREEYQLPVLVDEFGYEGNIALDWGNITGFELINLMWTAICFGCYCSHGETFHRDDEVLWWSKGGKLYGESPDRIAFLNELLHELPGPMEPFANTLIRDPNAASTSPEQAAFFHHLMNNMGGQERAQIIKVMTKPIGRHPDYRLQYLGRNCPVYIDHKLPENGRYKVEAIDVWDMTRHVVRDECSGTTRVSLPGKEGMAILTTRISGDAL